MTVTVDSDAPSAPRPSATPVVVASASGLPLACTTIAPETSIVAPPRRPSASTVGPPMCASSFGVTVAVAELELSATNPPETAREKAVAFSALSALTSSPAAPRPVALVTEPSIRACTVPPAVALAVLLPTPTRPPAWPVATLSALEVPLAVALTVFFALKFASLSTKVSTCGVSVDVAVAPLEAIRPPAAAYEVALAPVPLVTLPEESAL